MKYKNCILLCAGVFIAVLLTHSCKKNNDDSVSYFLTSGTWSLASLQVYHYIGDTLKKTDTINIFLPQKFTFSTNNSCTYSNFKSIAQTSTGQWQFNEGNLTIQANMVCKDSLNGKAITSQPFSNARVNTLGQFSLVLETDSINTYYTSKSVRQIKRYGFIHTPQ